MQHKKRTPPPSSNSRAPQVFEYWGRLCCASRAYFSVERPASPVNGYPLPMHTREGLRPRRAPRRTQQPATSFRHTQQYQKLHRGNSPFNYCCTVVRPREKRENQTKPIKATTEGAAATFHRRDGLPLHRRLFCVQLRTAVLYCSQVSPRKAPQLGRLLGPSPSYLQYWGVFSLYLYFIPGVLDVQPPPPAVAPAPEPLFANALRHVEVVVLQVLHLLLRVHRTAAARRGEGGGRGDQGDCLASYVMTSLVSAGDEFDS